MNGIMIIGKMSTDQILNETISKLTIDISKLSVRRSKAVDTFRQTAEDLQSVNDGLKVSIDSFDRLRAFIEDKRSEAERMISDNENVRKKIFDIIGEQ